MVLSDNFECIFSVKYILKLSDLKSCFSLRSTKYSAVEDLTPFQTSLLNNSYNSNIKTNNDNSNNVVQRIFFQNQYIVLCTGNGQLIMDSKC